MATHKCSIYIYIYKYIAVNVINAINALYFVHRAPYGGEDSTLYVIYKYIYIYIYIFIYIYQLERVIFTRIQCSMYKVQSVDSRNTEKERPILCYSEFRAKALVRKLYIHTYIYIYIYIYICIIKDPPETSGTIC